jgi:hypothetical protein
VLAHGASSANKPLVSSLFRIIGLPELDDVLAVRHLLAGRELDAQRPLYIVADLVLVADPRSTDRWVTCTTSSIARDDM